jgi:hypothetical protein
MKNTIEQLKQQAGIKDNPDQEGLNLFAELIIKECISIVDFNILSKGGIDPESFKGEVVISSAIKKHFNIE